MKCLQHHSKYYLVGGDFFVIVRRFQSSDTRG